MSIIKTIIFIALIIYYIYRKWKHQSNIYNSNIRIGIIIALLVYIPISTASPETYNYTNKFNITDISNACRIVNNSFIGTCTFVYGTDYIIILLTIIAFLMGVLVIERLSRRLLKKV